MHPPSYLATQARSIRLRASRLRRDASAFALRDYGVMQWRDGNVGRESIFVMQIIGKIKLGILKSAISKFFRLLNPIYSDSTCL